MCSFVCIKYAVPFGEMFILRVTTKPSRVNFILTTSPAWRCNGTTPQKQISIHIIFIWHQIYVCLWNLYFLWDTFITKHIQWCTRETIYKVTSSSVAPWTELTLRHSSTRVLHNIKTKQRNFKHFTVSNLQKYTP
jgi:hypothetical protein